MILKCQPEIIVCAISFHIEKQATRLVKLFVLYFITKNFTKIKSLLAGLKRIETALCSVVQKACVQFWFRYQNRAVLQPWHWSCVLIHTVELLHENVACIYLKVDTFSCVELLCWTAPGYAPKKTQQPEILQHSLILIPWRRKAFQPNLIFHIVSLENVQISKEKRSLIENVTIINIFI